MKPPKRVCEKPIGYKSWYQKTTFWWYHKTKFCGRMHRNTQHQISSRLIPAVGVPQALSGFVQDWLMFRPALLSRSLAISLSLSLSLSFSFSSPGASALWPLCLPSSSLLLRTRQTRGQDHQRVSLLRSHSLHHRSLSPYLPM